MATGEIQPSAIKIDRLVSRISEGDIKIPAFQRGFVWNQQQIIDLLDSLYHNYPIGSILLWSSYERLKSSRNIGGLKLPDREPEYPVNYVLDGQQRLATIFAAFCSQRDLQEEDGRYTVSPETFEISFRFDDESFIPSSSVEPSTPALSLSCLFDTEAFFAELEKLPPELQKAAKNLFSRINNYEIPVVTISKRLKDEVGVIFERINSTGTTLTTLDLLVAWTWSEDFHLQDALSRLTEMLDAKAFGDIPDKIILQCLAGIIAESTKTKTILSLRPEDVRARFEDVGTAIARAVDFLSTELLAQSLDFLPHLQQLVGLSYFYHHRESPTADQADALKKWFWKTSFSRRYSAQTDDKMNADISFMKEVLKENNAAVATYSSEISKDALVNQKFSKSHPYTRALLLLLAQKSPLDLINGTRINLGDALSAYNRKEYHHIFPQAFLRKRGLPSDKINALCNFCFLPAGSNKKISQKEPSEYILELVPDSNRKQILESNLMPLRMEIYKNNNYDEFISQRADLIAQFFDSIVI